MEQNQYYIMEIQQYQNGEYGRIVHFAYDENPDKAKLKAESKYHEVLAAAAISELPMHTAVLISADGFPLMHQCYKHEQPTPQPEEVEEVEQTEEPTEGETNE